MAQFHIYNQTVADGTATSVVRPSDWNSVHSNLVTLSGNTAGVSTVSGTNIVYQGGNNIIASGVQGANAATIIFSGSNQSVQTQASGNIAGIGYTSTTQAGSTVGATHNTAGLSMAWPPFLTTAQPAGAYLTTARASNDAIGLNTAVTNVTATINSSGFSFNAAGYAGTTTGFTGANISGSMTHNSAGLALSLSAAAGGGGADGVNIVQIGTTGTTGTSFSSISGTVQINGSNNITVSQNNSNQIVISGPTLTQYLTTARASNDAVGLNTALTANGVSWTVNSSGISLNVPAFLTTAALSNHSHNFATTTTNGSLIVVATTNSAGATIAVPPFITTAAAQTNQTLSMVMTSNTTGNVSSATVDARSITYQGMGIASVGWSTSAGGSSLIISVPSGGGAGDGGNTLAVAGSTAGSNSLVLFSNSPTVTFGMAGNTITASAAGGGGGAATIGGYEVFQLNNATTFSSAGQNSIYFQKFQPVANVSFNNLERRMSGSSASSAIAVNVNHTIDYGMYSLQTGASSTQYSLIASSQMIIQASYSSNLSAGYTISQGAASYTSTSAGTVVLGQLTGFRHLYMPFTSTITAGGAYAIAMRISSATTGNTGAFRMALKEMSNMNNLTIGKLYATTVLATNASFVGDFAQGVYSATSSNLPNTMALSGLTNAVSQNRMYIQLEV